MKQHERGGGRDFICGPKRLISQMNRFKIRNESNVARKLRFDRSPPAADAPGARMPKGQVPWASDKQRLAGGFGSMVDFFSPPPKPPQVGRPAGVPRKKRGRPPAAPVVGAADQTPFFYLFLAGILWNVPFSSVCCCVLLFAAVCAASRWRGERGAGP